MKRLISECPECKKLTALIASNKRVEDKGFIFHPETANPANHYRVTCYDGCSAVYDVYIQKDSYCCPYCLKENYDYLDNPCFSTSKDKSSASLVTMLICNCGGITCVATSDERRANFAESVNGNSVDLR